MYTNSSPNNQRGGIVTWIFTTGGFIIHRRSWEFSLPPSEEDRHLRNAFDRLRHASAGNETSKRQSQSPRDATKEREIHFIPSPVKDTSSIIPSSPRWLGRSCSAWVRCRRTHPRSSWNGSNLRRRSPSKYWTWKNQHRTERITHRLLPNLLSRALAHALALALALALFLSRTSKKPVAPGVPSPVISNSPSPNSSMSWALSLSNFGLYPQAPQ